MKKLVKLLLCLTLVLALTGCGKEQTATYKMEQDTMGIKISDTYVITAKGDKVTKMEEVCSIDISALDDAQKEAVIATYDEQYGAMKDSAPDSVVFDISSDDNSYTVKVDYNIEEADLKALADAGYIQATNDGKILYVSFKQTCEGLAASGYSAVE